MRNIRLGKGGEDAPSEWGLDALLARNLACPSGSRVRNAARWRHRCPNLRPRCATTAATAPATTASTTSSAATERHGRSNRGNANRRIYAASSSYRCCAGGASIFGADGLASGTTYGIGSKPCGRAGSARSGSGSFATAPAFGSPSRHRSRWAPVAAGASGSHRSPAAERRWSSALPPWAARLPPQGGARRIRRSAGHVAWHSRDA